MRHTPRRSTTSRWANASPVLSASHFMSPTARAKAVELEAAGAERIAGPVTTPWNDRNVRLQTADGTQLTLFTTLE